MKSRSKDHSKLICDIGELGGIFADSSGLENFLQKIVEMISAHMHSAVCSIYLYNESKAELTLKTTTGLKLSRNVDIKLKLGEGLTGLALKELIPIFEKQASKNPNFKHIPGIGEEKFESFLAVPLCRGTTRIGVLVIQNEKKDYFTEEDISVFKAISAQLVNTIEMTKAILAIEEKKEKVAVLKDERELTFVKGQVGSPGFARGKSVVIKMDQALKTYQSRGNKKRCTIEDFRIAVEQSEKQLEDIQEQIEEKLSDVASQVFAAHILMLKDRIFIKAIEDQIKNGTHPVEAIYTTVQVYVSKFENIPNQYLKERSQDIKDIGRRLIENILGHDEHENYLHNKIVIAEELFPSDALKLSSQKVRAIVLLSGGVTSHLSILSRSLEMPLIIVDEARLYKLKDDTDVLVDANNGSLYINPSQQILESYKELLNYKEHLEKLALQVTDITQTYDKIRVRLFSNINLLGDLKNARAFKAEGIGLYRTEFPFIVRNNFPSEEEQYVIYKKLVENAPGDEINFRTLDIGGDKVLSYFEHHLKEKNPYLGMRSIRFSLNHVEIFSQQIRAILRAAAGSNVRIMFPMISSIDEFKEAKGVVVQCIRQLKKEGIFCHQKPKIGVMIELPSVLEIIDELAKEVDFFSIGTNDFIQYMLAVDRTNEKVSQLYLPYHPSVLRAINKVVDAGNRAGIDVSVCGDMAHNAQYMEFLLGIGVRKLSVDSTLIPEIQKVVSKIRIKKAQQKAANLLKKSSIKEVLKSL